MPFHTKIAYKMEYSNCDVPLNHNSQGETLGQWVHRQRDLYNEGTLDEDRHVLLSQKGFVFEPGTNVTITIVGREFKRTIKELAQFKR